MKHFRSCAGVAARSGWPMRSWPPGPSARDAGDWKTARALVEEALALSKALGDVRMHDHCEAQLAVIAFAAGQMAEAIDRAKRAVEASRRHGTLTAEFLALHCAGRLSDPR